MKPHLVKEIENPITRDMRLTVPRDDGRIGVAQADIDVIKRGMENVTTNPSGTAFQVFRNAAYLAAGKTGTAQVFSLQGAKYHGHALAEHLRDHALFIAFAPADNPKIAVALIVENGGWGAQAAGPIARRVLDYYLVDRLKPGVEAAAVTAAASATEDASAPVIGTAPQPAQPEAAQPVAVAAGVYAVAVAARHRGTTGPGAGCVGGFCVGGFCVGGFCVGGFCVGGFCVGGFCGGDCGGFRAGWRADQVAGWSFRGQRRVHVHVACIDDINRIGRRHDIRAGETANAASIRPAPTRPASAAAPAAAAPSRDAGTPRTPATGGIDE